MCWEIQSTYYVPGKARMFAQFIPRATQDVVTTADSISQRMLRPGEAKRPVKVMQQVAEQELRAHPSARNTVPYTPDSAQTPPLQGAFPGRFQADAFCVSPTSVGGHAFDLFVVSLTPSLLLYQESHQVRDPQQSPSRALL